MFVKELRSGNWWEVRTDAKLPGTLLLRDPSDNVYFITYNNIQQVCRAAAAVAADDGAAAVGRGRAGLCERAPALAPASCTHHPTATGPHRQDHYRPPIN